MTFAWIWCFIALPLPWLAGWRRPPADDEAALLLPRLPADAGSAPGIFNTAPRWLALLLWLLLVAAAARPQLPGEPLNALRTGRSMMLAFDVSASMGTADLQLAGQAVDRLQAAKTLTDAYLEKRQGDRIGLIVFGSQAYLHTPMTFDIAALRSALAGTELGLAGRETALGDAIALATKHLRGQADADRSLVIITDGASNSGTLTPQRAAWLARREGVRIHSISLGANQSANEIDEKAPREIAEQTGGSYLHATDSKALAAFWQQLIDVPASVQGSTIIRPRQELYHWPLGLALLIALALAVRQVRRCPA